MTPAEGREPRSARAELPALILILAIAAGLRLVGIRWGLPNALHDYSYHPDEFLTVGTAFGMAYLGQSVVPRFYNYPSLYIYLSTLAIVVGMGYSKSPDVATAYLAARVLTALMGTAAVAVTWWAGRTLFGGWVGILAALILCVAPLHVQHSHFATVDVPSTLFVAATLGFAGLILKRGDRRDYIWAGVMAGLAAGTKYNAGLVIFAVIAAHFLRGRGVRTGRLWAAIGCCVGAYVLSTPGSVLRLGSFIHGISYEMLHAAVGHGLVFAGTGYGFVYTLTSSLRYGLGGLFMLLTLLALAYALVTRDKRALVVLAFALPYFALISVAQVRFARYSLPLFPAVALLCAWIVRDLCVRLAGPRSFRGIGRAITILAIAGALFEAVMLAAHIDLAFVVASPQDRAARWMLANVPRGSRIGTMDVPWFYSPPLEKSLGLGTIDQRREAMNRSPYRFVVFSDSQRQGDWWRGGWPPKWVILSDFETADAERLRGNKSISSAQRRQVGRILADLAIVRKRYRVRTGFGGLFPMLEIDRFPHDMRYADPDITIYELRK